MRDQENIIRDEEAKRLQVVQENQDEEVDMEVDAQDVQIEIPEDPMQGKFIT